MACHRVRCAVQRSTPSSSSLRMSSIEAVSGSLLLHRISHRFAASPVCACIHVTHPMVQMCRIWAQYEMQCMCGLIGCTAYRSFFRYCSNALGSISWRSSNDIVEFSHAVRVLLTDIRSSPHMSFTRMWNGLYMSLHQPSMCCNAM